MGETIIKNLDACSPFSVYEGEEFCKLEREDGLYSHYIELDEFQGTIVKAANELLVVTKSILCQYFDRYGIPYTKQKMARELKLLYDNEYLDKWQFRTKKGPGSVFMVYQVGRKGRGFLGKNGLRVHLRGYLEKCSMSPEKIKKFLSANQALLALANRDVYIETGKMFISKAAYQKHTDKLFRSYGYIYDEIKKSVIFIEPIRNTQGNIEELLEKLKRMDATIKRHKTCNIELPDEITVLLVAEDRRWMDIYTEEFARCKFNTFHISLTYDRLMIMDSRSIESKYIELKVLPWWKRLAG